MPPRHRLAASNHGLEPPATVEPVGERPRPPRRFGGLLVLVLVLVLVVAGVGGAGYWIWSNGRDHIDRAAVGDCVREAPEESDAPYRIVECSDPAATLRVMRLKPLGNDSDCREVAGASRSVFNSDANVCLGEKDVDPDRAVNAAEEGDCLADNGGEAQRVDCADPTAKYRVLKRLSNVLGIDVNASCAKVAGSVNVFCWNWESTGQFGGVSRLSTDLVLCLGNN